MATAVAVQATSSRTTMMETARLHCLQPETGTSYAQGQGTVPEEWSFRSMWWPPTPPPLRPLQHLLLRRLSQVLLPPPTPLHRRQSLTERWEFPAALGFWRLLRRLFLVSWAREETVLFFHLYSSICFFFFELLWASFDSHVCLIFFMSITLWLKKMTHFFNFSFLFHLIIGLCYVILKNKIILFCHPIIDIYSSYLEKK